ncbi:protein geranylgeranyltransferase type II, alpha subunit, putative [Plasmodium gallinaceum]|uniref:Protein farnesyltransferase/geranylgeranyltransferase type-1 subunit alpha n=1 Tax=Plasmodium gallinaceum TaxID=5849 RepID=A0A1J1H186_PLAGA|nr:protein geranylgeranyltransferase type II, alpha subunit, putative [Plasmodium gallinaceum]CRG97053.1 protein geranylgeranyltransferase type II, alpha subunit, putative [Plasmodium gallinaceum]
MNEKMEKRNLYVYAKKFNLDYPETFDELNFRILNNPLFNLMKKKNFLIDICDLEKEKKKYMLEEEENIKDKDKINILNTYYSENERLLYSLLASLIENKIYSFEGYIVSSFVIKLNSSYYSAWIYRRKCLKKLNINLLNELKFTKFIINDNIKSFQSWFHRRWLVEYIYKLNEKDKKKNEKRKEKRKNNYKDESNSKIHINYDFFDDDYNFISDNESNSLEEDEYDNDFNEGFISNCDEKDFKIKKDNINLYDDLQNIIDNCNFFKNALKPNEIININEFLREEILYNNCDIFIDAKNYNSWAHKTWLVEKFSIFKNKYLCEKYQILLHEINFINYFLKNDIYNNSVWVYRYFIFNKLNYMNNIIKLEKEIVLCLTYSKQFYDNESLFNYFINIVFKYIELYKKEEKQNTNDIFDINIIQRIKNELTNLQTKSKFVLLFLSQLYSYNKCYNEVIKCYRYLEYNDDFNDQVWKYKIEDIEKKN